MQDMKIKGVSFVLDAGGQASSYFGDLGHIEDCEAFAALLQGLFEIKDDIQLATEI